MPELPAIRCRLEPTRVPRPPHAVAAEGPARDRLLIRLRAAPGEELSRLAGAVTDDVLVIWGHEEALPWAEGVVYLAPVEDAPRLWLPTRCRLDGPAVLLEAALRRRVAADATFAWLPHPDRIIVLRETAPLTPEALAPGEGGSRIPDSSS